jgi:hypothetical protein
LPKRSRSACPQKYHGKYGICEANLTTKHPFLAIYARATVSRYQRVFQAIFKVETKTARRIGPLRFGGVDGNRRMAGEPRLCLFCGFIFFYYHGSYHNHFAHALQRWF